MIGLIFGRLTVIASAGANLRSQSLWICLCECGNLTEVAGYSLKSANTRSCGCLGRESRIAPRTHGFTVGRRLPPEYLLWCNIIQRCTNPKNRVWKHYGGRGITICELWRNDFAAFLSDVGRRPQPSLTLDRINNDGNYEPGNMRWATRSVQNKNRRRFSHLQR